MKLKEKLKRLYAQEENLSTECVIVDSVIEYTEECVENSTDDEIMRMHDSLQSRIKEHQTKEDGQSLDYVEVSLEKMDMGVKVALNDVLDKICLKQRSFTILSLEKAN